MLLFPPKLLPPKLIDGGFSNPPFITGDDLAILAALSIAFLALGNGLELNPFFLAGKPADLMLAANPLLGFLTRGFWVPKLVGGLLLKDCGFGAPAKAPPLSIVGASKELSCAVGCVSTPSPSPTCLLPITD